MQLVSGRRRCPLEIQALAKSFEGATSRSNEVPAVYFRLRIEAVAQLAGKGRRSLCRERQCVLENVRGSALHGRILSVAMTGETDLGNMIVPLLGPLTVELLDAARGAAIKRGGCRPIRSATVDGLARDETKERLHRPASK